VVGVSKGFFDVTHLLEMRAHSPEVSCEIVSHARAQDSLDDTSVAPCFPCRQQADGRDISELETSCYCEYILAITREKWAGTWDDDIAYTKPLSNLINHDNDTWLNDIRQGKLGACCYWDALAGRWDAFFRFKERVVAPTPVDGANIMGTTWFQQRGLGSPQFGSTFFGVLGHESWSGLGWGIVDQIRALIRTSRVNVTTEHCRRRDL
jgi:hypothetical protein